MFCFSIRDVLWLTALVAMGVAWWMDRQATTREQAALQSERAALAKEKTMLRAEAQKRGDESERAIRELMRRQGNTRRPLRQPTTLEPLPQLIQPLYYPPDPNAL
jgi:cell division protein FtsB